jgi:hypothetical protein
MGWNRMDNVCLLDLSTTLYLTHCTSCSLVTWLVRVIIGLLNQSRVASYSLVPADVS